MSTALRYAFYIPKNRQEIIEYLTKRGMESISKMPKKQLMAIYIKERKAGR